MITIEEFYDSEKYKDHASRLAATEEWPDRYGPTWPLQRYRAKVRDNLKCAECGRDNPVEVDHIKPVDKGGTNELDNLQTLCIPCHYKKHGSERWFLNKQRVAQLYYAAKTEVSGNRKSYKATKKAAKWLDMSEEEFKELAKDVGFFD